jgi:hypothetical protein
MMKAISLWNPWAMLVPWKEKGNETRSWPTPYRGLLAIHATANVPPVVKRLCHDEPFKSILAKHGAAPSMKGLPFGAVIAVCNLVDCQKVVSRTLLSGVPKLAKLEDETLIEGNELAFGDYTPGRYVWILRDIHQLAAPIPFKGQQGFWNWDDTPNLVAIDPWIRGSTRIWTPKGVISGRRLDRPDEDAIKGLEVE